ncbi:hypothetical protein [Streptomyces sp. NPDC001851]|uniref:hypothetical protein n=1 Tax=Streptomyces sp. NPDC001851 TaxID=3154529 RepID=UPI00333352ED
MQLVEAIGAWRDGHGGVVAARARVTALGLPGDPVGQAGPLLPAANRAALQVVDAQYGGILSRSAGVLVVCRQWTRRGGTVSAGGTTVDALRPAHPGPAPRSLAPDVRAVLSDDRIVLPPAAAADLRSGQVHPGVARAVRAPARTYRLEVSVVRSTCGGSTATLSSTRRRLAL